MKEARNRRIRITDRIYLFFFFGKRCVCVYGCSKILFLKAASHVQQTAPSSQVKMWGAKADVRPMQVAAIDDEIMT